MKKSEKPESIWWNLGLNVFLPVLFLRKGDQYIDSPAAVLIIALAFPVGYFLYDLKTRGKKNFISILGFISVLITGGIGLFELPRFWVIVKETAIPAILGLVILGSLFTRYPLIKTIILTPQLFDVERIQRALEERGTTARFQSLLNQATILLAISFFISAVLNYFVAQHFIQTEPSVDPVRFNEEVGNMTFWSMIIIAVPSMVITMGIIFFLVRGIKINTGLSMEEALAEQHRQGPEEARQ
jgi:intracellular septation protein A